MICKGCGKEFQGLAAYCLQCEMRQLADSVSSTSVPSNSAASKASDLDFDVLYQRKDSIGSKRDVQQGSGKNKAIFFAWFTVLIIASAGLSRLSFANTRFGIAADVGYTIGLMLVVLVIAGFFRLFTKTGFGKFFLVTWFVVVVIEGAGTILESRGIASMQAMSAIKSQHDAVQRLLDTAKGTAPTSQSAISAAPDSQPYVEPDGDALTDAIKQITMALAQYNQHISELNREQEALGLSEILKPHNLVNKAGIQRGRDAVASYARILNDYQVSYEGYVDKVQQILESAPPASRQHLLQAFQKSVAETRDAISAFVNVERQLMSTIASLLDLAQANLGVSRVQGNVIYLPKRALLGYQQHVANLQALAYQEKEAADRLARIRRLTISQWESINNTYGSK